jgi:hypothetical protein
MYHQYREELCLTLAKVKSIALTVDIWTKNKTSFLCLTGHVFSKTFESVPLVLGFRHFVGAHTADKIKRYIIYEITQLQIKHKVSAIVSDNGSDIKKAINDIKYGLRLSCLAHNINLVVKNGLDLYDNPKKKKYVVFSKKIKK